MSRHRHHWRAPWPLVGGCESNPGVQSLGGQCYSAEERCRCGARKVTVTREPHPDEPRTTARIDYPDGLWPWGEDCETPGEAVS